MDWWKLFGGTFILIFLAELGDKTQLAALAKTADSPDNSMAKWIVFLGASLALVASTFIAVFLGHLLKTLVPDERYIKIAAGGLFLVFGAMILYEVYRSYQGAKRPVEAPPTAAEMDTAASGLVGGLALKAAMDFESFAAQRYRKLAADADPALAALLLELAGEEDSHLARLRGLPEEAGKTGEDATACPKNISARVIYKAPGSSETLAELVRHEEATAAFYQNLADRTLLSSARAVFARLADEERGHARRLAMAGGECGPPSA